MADMYQRSVDELKQVFGAQGGLDSLKSDMKLQKALELLVENSKKINKE